MWRGDVSFETACYVLRCPFAPLSHFTVFIRAWAFAALFDEMGVARSEVGGAPTSQLAKSRRDSEIGVCAFCGAGWQDIAQEFCAHVAGQASHRTD